MNNKKYYFIYKTTNIINNKIYIGQHSTNKLNDGYIGCGIYNSWCGNVKTSYFHSAVRKYGYKNFKLEILEFCIPCIYYINEREKYYISKYKSTDSSIGYNLSEGGGQRANIVISEQTRQKISNFHLGKNKTKSHAEKIKKYKRDIAKNVFVYTVNGDFIGEFNSIPDASESLNLNINAIRNSLYRSIRYKDYIFSHNKIEFTQYIARRGNIRKIYVLDNSFEVIDTSESIIELSEKYKINYNCLNSRCNRFSNINGLYFIKENKLELFFKNKKL